MHKQVVQINLICAPTSQYSVLALEQWFCKWFSYNMLHYCFAEKKGYSKFGIYTGNGNADGTFVYTGFKPAFIMLKCICTSTQNWVIVDNKRDGFNADNNTIMQTQLDAETTNTDVVDLLSNGFKNRRYR